MVVAAVGGSLLALGAAPAHAASSVVPASPPPNVFQARTTTAAQLPDAAGAPQIVEDLFLPGGPWTVTSNATAVNFGPGDFIRCQLRASGTLIDGGATTYLANRVGGLVNVATWQTGAGFVAELICSHDNAASYPGQFYFDPGITLTAVRGGPISSPTVHTNATPAVVQSRTSSSVGLTYNSPQGTTVTSVALTAGTWALVANLSAVDFTNPDSIDCFLYGPAGVTVFSSEPNVDAGPADAFVSSVALAGSVVLGPAGGTVAVQCLGRQATGLYVDPGATLTATLVQSASNLSGKVLAGEALPDSGGVSANVMSRSMPAGAWRITSMVAVGLRAPNNGYAGGNDFVRCGLLANGARIDGGATARWLPDDHWQEIVNSGTFTATTRWTLTLSCAHDGTISNGDHWTVLDGIVLDVRKGPISAG
jgi:hypothetical protein